MLVLLTEVMWLVEIPDEDFVHLVVAEVEDGLTVEDDLVQGTPSTSRATMVITLGNVVEAVNKPDVEAHVRE